MEAESFDGDRLGTWLREGAREVLDRFTCGVTDVIGVMDRSYTIRYVNRTAPGLSRELVVGKSAFDLIPPSEAKAAREAFDQVLSAGTPSRFEITFENQQGVTVYVVWVYPIVHEREIIGAFTLNVNATDERRETIDRDRFFSLSLDLMIVATRDAVLRRINPAFAEALGYATSDLVGRPFGNFLHPDDVERTLAAFGRVLAGDLVGDFENRYRRHDGAFRTFSWKAIVDPVTADVYAVARDITEQRATEAALRQAQKMEAVGQLAGGIAHDFNNLLLAVLANVELALLSTSTPEDVVEHLNEIANAGKRAGELTRQLLAFSRRQRLDRVPIDVNGMLLGLMKLVRRLLPENIQIDVQLEQGLASVDADQSQLEQVMINLCVNARDAMAAGGKLVLRTGQVVLPETDRTKHPWLNAGPFVCVTVADNGTGMSAEVRERAFEPFFTTKGDRGGTGLGLSTLYGIVQQHGGMVELESELGRGTTFKVYLPVDGRPAKRAHLEQEIERPAGRKQTILLAEDEEVVRRPLLKILQGAGYETLAASNGKEAIALLRENLDRVSLVILDVVMPEVGGPEAWQEMHRLRPDLGVIFMTGHADVHARASFPEGAEILDKPFSTGDLRSLIEKKLK